MFEILHFIQYIALQGIGLIILLALAAGVVFWVLKKFHSWKTAGLLFAFFFGLFLLFWVPSGWPQSFSYPPGMTHYGPKESPALPLENVFSFFNNLDDFKRVDDIAKQPGDIPPPIERTSTTTVDITLEAREVLAEMAPGVTMNYWTYNGTVPGPFLRVREGDQVNLTLKNHPSSLHHHNIDLHAVNGPGGGATATNVAPGESRTFSFKAKNPGLYVYHCAHTNVATHMAHGMYGLILVEPKEGLSEVDKEFYMMQGEAYTAGQMGKKGLQVHDAQSMLNGDPTYITFNGRTKALVDNMNADTNESVRFFVGNGGVNLNSSFHLIGEIFDTVYDEGGIADENIKKNIQTTMIPAGGAAITTFETDVPGEYVFLDHALARIDRGVWGVLDVNGPKDPEVFEGSSDHAHEDQQEHNHE